MQTKQKFSFLKFIGIALLIPLILIDCREDTASPTPLAISITAEDVGVTDALIKLKVEFNAVGGISYQLKRDGQIIFTLSYPYLAQRSVLDTLILDEGLLPKHTYTYKAYRMIATAAIDSSTPLAFTTMDTTSHNFTWQIDTLGDGSSSVLYDVAIINDTLAYAVGEIYKRDSTGQFETTMYNMAKWNGQDWKLERAYFYWQGQSYVTQLYSVFAFAEDDIWVGTGGPYHWDGHIWTTYNINGIFDGVVNKFWGTSSSNLYIVGTNGSIAHFNGSSWRKIESGTTLDIQDIWGSIDKKNNETEVIAVASNQWKSADRKILKISGINTMTLSDTPLKYPLSSIYFESDRKYYVAGDGIFEKRLLSDASWHNKPSDFAQYFIFRTRGSNLNDIVAVGGYGEAVHFNGSSWKSYHDIVGIGYGNYYSVSIKDKMVVIVGQEYPMAVVAIGKRE